MSLSSVLTPPETDRRERGVRPGGPLERYLASSVAPGAEDTDAAALTLRGFARVGRRWLPFRGSDVVAPRVGYLLRAHVLGVVRVVEQEREGTAMRRVGVGRLVEEDDSADAARHARTHRAVAALWVPGALRPASGARWEELDEHRLRVVADDLDLTVHVHPRGGVTALRTVGWGDPSGTGRPGWHPLGYDVLEHHTYGTTTIPATVCVAWFPDGVRRHEVLRVQVVDWTPHRAEEFR